MMLVFRYDPSFMEKKPPEKSFQTKILKMAVESKQVDIEKNSKMENFACFKRCKNCTNKCNNNSTHIRYLSKIFVYT